MIKYNSPKDKVQNVKNELKHRINAADKTNVFHIQKAFSYLDVLKQDDDEDNDSIYSLILFKLKRMRNALKNDDFFFYDKYAKSLDWCINCFNIYLDEDIKIDINNVNLKNIPCCYKKLIHIFNADEITKISNHEFNFYQIVITEYYKDKALKTAFHLLANKSRDWWV